MDEYLAFEDLVERGVYKIHSRNLEIGVWTGQGFMGLREKFGYLSLFTEYPNTASAEHLLPYELPGQVRLQASEAGFDGETGRFVGFTPSPDASKPAHEQAGYCETWGWYFLDTREFSDQIHAMSRTYQPLFQFLVGVSRAEWAATAGGGSRRRVEEEPGEWWGEAALRKNDEPEEVVRVGDDQ